MELRQLTYFLTAAQTQNFRKAAELCLVAQPALSRQIAALEAELGVALFRRVKQRVVLTSAGLAFAIYARNALDLLQQGRQEMVRLQEGQSGAVLIGCNKSLAASFLPPLITSFHQRYPAVHLKIVERHSDEIVTMVEQEEVDLGFIFDPVVRSEVVVVQELFRQPLYLLASSEHPLAHAEPSALTLARIAAEPLFLLGEAARLRKVLERIFVQRGLTLQPMVEIESSEGLKELVRRGSGVTLMPPALLHSSQDERGLTLLPVFDVPDEFIFALVYRRFGTISPPARQFINLVIDAMADSP